MKSHKIPIDLQFRVRRYIEYVIEKSKESVDDNELLEMLSEPL
jgi:hypothetical protein